VCAASAVDPDGGEVALRWRWTLDDQPLTSTSGTLDGPFVVGSELVCTPFVGEPGRVTALGEPAVLRVTAMAPVVTSVEVVYDGPAWNDNDYLCVADGYDPDGGPLTWQTSWRDFLGPLGVVGPQITLDGPPHLPGWPLVCEVTATDGDGEQATGSTAVMVENRPPVAVAMPDVERRLGVAAPCPVEVADADRETLRIVYDWVRERDGLPLGRGAAPIIQDPLAIGDVALCTVWAVDGSGATATATGRVLVVP
jgi:hypothetical protein